MEIKELFEDINWKSLIIGGAIFAFLVVLAIDYKLEILLMFSSAGLLYIGYGSKNKIQGGLLGAIGTIPLFLLTIIFNRLGAINGEGLEIWMLIIFLAIGGLCGFIGANISKARKKTMKPKAIGKNKSNKKPPKGLRNRK